MKGFKVSQRYAKGFFDFLTTESSDIEKYYKDLSFVFQSINDNALLNKFLNSPVVSDGTKSEKLKNIFTSLQPQTVSFLALVCKNGRASILDMICQSFFDLVDEKNGLIHTELVLADSLADDLVQKIVEQSKKHLKIVQSVKLKVTIDPKIFGGFIIRFKTLEMDHSIVSKLVKLKQIF